MSSKRKKVLIILLVLLAVLLLLNGPVSRLQAASEISFSGSELLGNPTDTSITVNVVPEESVYIYFEYGTSSGAYTLQTTPEPALADEPYEVVINGLQADTEYYYRMRYAQIQSDSNYIARLEGNFHTARPEGSSYEFVLTADSHINLQLGVLSQWQTTLGMIADDNPDFMIDLGDTFGMDGVASAAAADAAYLYQRDPAIMGLASHTVPIFLAMGNHENEEGWNFNDTNPQPVYGMRARKSYFPLPSPLTDPSFYSANTDQLEQSDVANGDYIIGDDQYRENYYAWEWGDALFVVFDPFQYTMQIPYNPSAGESNDETVGGDRWNWTMGQQQHQWLRDTLRDSDAKYKFLIAHHMVGGTENYVRGGAQAARWFEWGGCSANAPDACTDDTHASWEFDTRRPAAAGWIEPVHQLMQEYGVQAFFHGHDHQFVHEERDGIVYQLVPAASQNTGTGFNLYTGSPYVQPGGNLGNSGYLRITVAPNEATVEYVKTVDNNPSVVGDTVYEYTIEPNETTEPDFTITATANLNGSISPSGAVGVMAGDDQSFTITPNSGYQVADVLVDGGSIGAAANYTFNNVQADHTIAASFEPVSVPTGEVTVDGAAMSEAADDVSSISFAHTTGTGSDRLMLVGVSWNSGSAEREITSVTFSYGAGPTVLNLDQVIDQQAASQPRNAAIYSLLNPPSGQAGTVTVTFSGSVSNGIVAGAANFAGVNQADPLGTAVGATASSSAEPSVTLTGLNGDELVFDAVFQGASDVNQTLTPGAGQSEQWNDWIANTRAAASVEEAEGSVVTMSWTAASTAVWVSVAVPINPAPAGTTYDLTIVSDGNGTTTPSIGVHTYAEDTIVSISAAPSSGYIFDSWSGDADCADGSVTMDANKSCTSIFAPVPPGVITFVGDVGAATIKDNTNNDLVVDLSAGVAVSNTIIVAYATSPNPDLVVTVSDTAGNTYEQAVVARNFENGRTYLFYAYVENALDSNDTITITQSVSADPVPEPRSVVVSVFSGIAQNGLDQSLGNPVFEADTTVSGTAPSVGPTDTTIQANELVFSGIGTNGPVEDAAGMWQSGYTEGPRAGTTGGDAALNWTISTGWQIVSAIDQYTAGKSGVTDRQYAAVIATFRADTAPLPCYALTLEHSGDGSDPVASPTNSVGCASGGYAAGEIISLSGAVPDSGWEISGWTGTDDDVSTANANTLTMPANAHSVSVNYIEEASGLIFGDANEDGVVNSTDALVILTYDAGVAVPYSMSCSDVNDDDAVNSTDALIILSYDAGIIVPYPIGEACVPEP